MASARKKQDEKNLKILRELVSLPENRYCFDCNQRGPTYVNISIGSFVCTKCSGLLRGLTPPQRVKSISMATFTPEDINLIKTKGNYHCRKTWMALYDGIIPTDGITDEQKIRDFMIDKYEKKRYYVKQPSPTISEQQQSSQTSTTTTMLNKKNEQNNQRTKLYDFNVKQENNSQQGVVNNNNSNNNKTINNGKIKINGIGRPENHIRINLNKFNGNNTNKNNDFVADFSRADIFNGATMVNNNNFANFDDNPVFNNVVTNCDFSIFDLKFTSRGPVLNQVPLFPKCNVNKWSMQQSIATNNVVDKQQLPSEDKYAALKDLDNAFKSQPTIDWNNTRTHNALYNNDGTPSTGNSAYNSPVSQESSASSSSCVYGSPPNNQCNFPTYFNQSASNSHQIKTTSNPFNNSAINNPSTGFWNNSSPQNNIELQSTTVINNNGSFVTSSNNYQNPFRTSQQNDDVFNGGNGFTTNNFGTSGFIRQQQQQQQTNGSNNTFAPNPWTPNPFKVATPASSSNGFSSNPFL